MSVCDTRIAPQQHPFLAPQRAARRGFAEGDGPPRRACSNAAGAGRGGRVVAKARGDERDGAGEQNKACGEQNSERHAVAEDAARRPPHDAAEVGSRRQHFRRLQYVAARQGPVGEDRRYLQADDEDGADRGGDHLGDEPRTLRPAGVEQRRRERDRKRRRGGRHGGDHSVSTEPAPAAAHDQHVDERRRERQRHQADRQAHGRDAHGEQPVHRDRRREDQVEIGTRIEGTRHRLHRLRHHEQPRQQQACGDRHQEWLVDRRCGETADHRIGDGVHEHHEHGEADADLPQPLAPACGHHCDPVAPGEPHFVPREP
jgi:hypothetical protein